MGLKLRAVHHLSSSVDSRLLSWSFGTVGLSHAGDLWCLQKALLFCSPATWRAVPTSISCFQTAPWVLIALLFYPLFNIYCRQRCLRRRRGQPGGVGPFSQVTSDRRGETASGCTRGSLSWILVEMSSLKGCSGLGTGCPGQWESPPLEVSKKHMDVALGDMVWWWTWWG